MAMTYGCARCHTHKFDPILHTDYYRLQAFFANTAADDEIPMISPAERKQFEVRKAVWDEKTKPVRERIALLLEPQKQKILKDFFDKYPPEIQAAITKAPAARNPFEWQMYAKAKPYLEIDDDQASKALKGADRAQYTALLAELQKFADIDPGELPVGIGMHDLSNQSPATHRLNAGSWDAPAEEVQPGFLSIVNASAPNIVPLPNSTGRRPALANWLASPDNQLVSGALLPVYGDA